MTGSADDARVKAVMTALRTARAAAIGGLVFAALMAVVLFLFRAAFPVDQYLDTEAMPSPEALSQARTALFLVPYAGIAFIWFTAALHYNLGSTDQRLFTTVFISSGLLFVAVVFVAAAFASAELTALERGIDLTEGNRVIPAVAVNELLVGYSARMSAVFCLSLSTMGRIRKALPPWLYIFGTATGLFLLLVPFGVPLVEFLFPVWVATISLFLLIKNPGGNNRASAETP
jgi:hypothetical protein